MVNRLRLTVRSATSVGDEQLLSLCHAKWYLCFYVQAAVQLFAVSELHSPYKLAYSLWPLFAHTPLNVPIYLSAHYIIQEKVV